MTEKAEVNELIADVREHLVYLRELGLEGVYVQLSDAVSRPTEAFVTEISNLRSENSNLAENSQQEGVSKTTSKSGESRLASLPSLSKRPTAVPSAQNEPEKALFDIAPALPEPVETVEQIRAEIGPDCVRCPLGLMGRKQVVNSVGDFNARLMFVGEAPGADEDE